MCIYFIFLYNLQRFDCLFFKLKLNVQVQYEIYRAPLFAASGSAVQESPIGTVKKCIVEPFWDVLVFAWW